MTSHLTSPRSRRAREGSQLKGPNRWTDVIVEHEIIEQIEEEPVGRPLKWCADLATSLGCADAMTTISQMWRAGYIALADLDGTVWPDWRSEEVWRAGVARSDVAVLATDLGSKWAYS